MRIDTLGVQAFLAVAEQGGFRKAADSLHITQTALTRRVQNLEGSLGVRLIERTTRSVSLTRIGREFLPRARRLLADLSGALNEIRETGRARRGDVAIACVPTVGVRYLPAVMQEYSERHPENRITIFDHTSAGVAELVLRRQVEFGINIGGPLHPELTSVALTQDRIVLVCRDDHPLAWRKAMTWRQLAPYPLIIAGEGSSNRPLLDASLGPQGLPLHAFYEVQRSSTAIGLVAKGVAAAVVPSLAIESDAYPRLRVVALTRPVISRALVLLMRKGASHTPAAQELIETLLRRRGRGAAREAAV